MSQVAPFTFSKNPPDQGTNFPVDMQKGDFLKKVFYSVEEPFTLTEGLPRDLKAASTNQKSTGSPAKAILNLFATYGEASEYAVRMNKPLVIMEIKVAATCVPQTALVSKIT